MQWFTEKKMDKTKHKCRGVSLLEVMMVLGVFAILLGVILPIADTVHKKEQALATYQEVMQILEIQKELNQNDTADLKSDGHFGLSGNDLAKTGMFPKKYVYQGAIVSPFGSSITIDNSSPGHFIVWLWKVPYESCVILATQPWKGLYQFGIGSVNLFEGGTNSSPYSGGYTLQKAEEACQTPYGKSLGTWMAIGFWADSY